MIRYKKQHTAGKRTPQVSAFVLHSSKQSLNFSSHPLLGRQLRNLRVSRTMTSCRREYQNNNPEPDDPNTYQSLPVICPRRLLHHQVLQLRGPYRCRERTVGFLEQCCLLPGRMGGIRGWVGIRKVTNVQTKGSGCSPGIGRIYIHVDPPT